MKKFLIAIIASAMVLASASAQMLKTRSFQNVMWTGLGLPYADDGDDGHGKFSWTGVIDMLQVRLDFDKWFTIDGGLAWGIPEMRWPNSDGPGDLITFLNTKDNQFTFMGENRDGKDHYDNHYVNFILHPFKGFDAGVGLRLNWSVGPSPQTEADVWMPLAHVAQGDLRSGAPTVGESKIVGFMSYSARKWADKAIAVRYTLGFNEERTHYIQFGFAVPDGASSGTFVFNTAVEVKPIDLLLIAAAYQHEGRKLYTGLKLDFSQYFKVDAWFDINGLGYDDWDVNKMLGTGAAVFIKFGPAPIWIKPEVGFSHYFNDNYSNSLYTGIRFNWDIVEKLHFGAWTSFAWGARDKHWPDETHRGFIWNIRPDLTFDINKVHSIATSFEYELSHYPNDNVYNRFLIGFFWKVNKPF